MIDFASEGLDPDFASRHPGYGLLLAADTALVMRGLDPRIHAAAPRFHPDK
jgi:hypothetical protein